MADIDKRIKNLEITLTGPFGHPEQGIVYRYHQTERQVKSLFRAFAIAGTTVLSANILWLINMIMNRAFD